jgi:hypothetical protein
MRRYHTDIVKDTLDNVGRRAALLARQKNRSDLAPKPQHKDVLEGFCDDAILRILIATGKIRAHSGEPETQLNTSTGEEEETGLFLSDYIDADTDMSEMIPVELWPALTYAVLAEWFLSIGEHNIAQDFEGRFTSQLAQYRFGPNTPATASRPYRPI